jgi:hypothetical protein
MDEFFESQEWKEVKEVGRPLIELFSCSVWHAAIVCTLLACTSGCHQSGWAQGIFLAWNQCSGDWERCFEEITSRVDGFSSNKYVEAEHQNIIAFHALSRFVTHFLLSQSLHHLGR